MNIPKLGSYNNKLLHFSGHKPQERTLLDILGNQQDALDELSDLKENGDNNLVKGIARAMSNIVHKIVDTGEDLFSIVADGSVAMTNVSAHTIEDIGQSIEGIFDMVGGGPSAVLFGIDLLIIGYLIYRHFMEPRRQVVQDREIRVVRDNYLTGVDSTEGCRGCASKHDFPPPIPERKTESSNVS